MHSSKATSRSNILRELEGQPSTLMESESGKAAERLRRIPPYRQSKRILSSLDPSLKQVRLNALTDQKLLVIPSRSLKSGFLTVAPVSIPPHKRLQAIQPHQGNPFARRIPLGIPLTPAIDLIITGALAVGRDGSRLGDGHGHLDLQVAILSALGWLHPEVQVVTLVRDTQINASLPMETHDVHVHWIVTPHEAFATDHSESPLREVIWSRLDRRRIRRSDALFFLHRRQEAKGL